MTDGKKALLGCGAALVLAPLAVLLKSWVLTIMWGWFVVPLGLPQIGMAHAWGIVMVAAMLARSPDTETDDDEDKPEHRLWIAVAARSFGAPLFILMCGWLAQGWMP